MAAVVEGKPRHPTVALYNFCELWHTLPYPLWEMPNKLVEEFIIIGNTRIEKQRAIRESEEARNAIGSDASVPLR